VCAADRVAGLVVLVTVTDGHIPPPRPAHGDGDGGDGGDNNGGDDDDEMDKLSAM
jgi:hypothetical protein